MTQYQGENLRFREHRKLISGRMSGRNRAEQLDGDTDVKLAGAGSGDKMDVEGGEAGEGRAAAVAVAPLRGWAEEVEAEKEGKGLEMEWWDEAFLTKEIRDQKVRAPLGRLKSCRNSKYIPRLTFEY